MIFTLSASVFHKDASLAQMRSATLVFMMEAV